MIIDESILNKPTLSKEQRLANLVTDIKVNSTKAFKGLVDQYEAITRKVLKNTQFTPQEIFDSLGAEGSELVALANLIATTINTAKADTITVDLSTILTVNPDGTVTVASEFNVLAEGQD